MGKNSEKCDVQYIPVISVNQTHVHEFVGSTMLAETGSDKHNHRFEGISSEVIPMAGGGHVHELSVKTDYFDHYHEVGVRTGPAICVGCNKHIHFVKDVTTLNDGHFHNFVVATLIESPLTT